MDPETVKNEIREFIDRMGFGHFIETIEAYQGSANRFCVRIGNDANMLIGERGNNLVFMEHLLRKIIKRKFEQDERFILDINDYRMKRLEDLKQDVKIAAKSVRIHKKEVPLRPMSSFERRIVHLLLAEYPDIATESVGYEPERKVIIKPYP